MIRVLVVVAFTKEKAKKTEQQAKQIHNYKYFSVHRRFVFILCCVYMFSYGGSNITTTSVVLLSMNLNMMSTLNFKCEY